MSGYEFVEKEFSNLDEHGIRFTNESEETMFFGKVIYKNNHQRYLGKYDSKHGTCYIAVGNREFLKFNNLEVLQSKSNN